MPRAILVVDDEDDFLTTYRRLLRRDGYRVVAVGSRAAALDALAADRFVLVISDVRLTDGDGLDVVRGARAIDPPVPAIVVSGFTSEAARRAATEAGATAFVAKPFEATTLASRVRELAR